MKSVSWKGMIEFLGIAAIVASLIFVGLQLQQEQRIASIEAGFNLVESFYEQRNGTIENADTWVKGNAGEMELSPPEAVTYKALIRKQWAHAFWTTHALKQLGNDQNVEVHDFAGFLYRNPGARRMWETWMTVENEYRKKLMPVPVGLDMMDIVFSDLEKLQQLDSPKQNGN